MGKPSEKSLLKKQRKKEEKKQLQASVSSVNKANALSDPLQDFPAFKEFKNGDLHVTFVIKKVGDLEESTIDWMFNLLKFNMMEFYNACEWGWNDISKRNEMTEYGAWYLIAYSGETPVAFSHFRFDIDYGIEVLYCYEIQLEPSVQRKRLGKFMMQLLELIAFKNNMRKVILTVLKNNPGSINFFQALKYIEDDTSPEDSYDETFCYTIVSKENKRMAMQDNNKLTPV